MEKLTETQRARLEKIERDFASIRDRMHEKFMDLLDDHEQNAFLFDMQAYTQSCMVINNKANVPSALLVEAGRALLENKLVKATRLQRKVAKVYGVPYDPCTAHLVLKPHFPEEAKELLDLQVQLDKLVDEIDCNLQ